MVDKMTQAGASEVEIRSAVSDCVYRPARQFKEAVAQRRSEENALVSGFKDAFDALKPVLSAYPESYEFQENSIYYDSKAALEKLFIAWSYYASNVIYGHSIVFRYVDPMCLATRR